MGFQHVDIDDGKYVGYFGNGEYLEYPLTDARTGEAAPSDYRYRGDAWVEAGTINVESASSYGAGYGGVRSWKIGDATQDSIDFRAGYVFGREQKRRRVPAESHGRDYYRGWYAAWDHKQLVRKGHA